LPSPCTSATRCRPPTFVCVGSLEGNEKILSVAFERGSLDRQVWLQLREILYGAAGEGPAKLNEPNPADERAIAGHILGPGRRDIGCFGKFQGLSRLSLMLGPRFGRTAFWSSRVPTGRMPRPRGPPSIN
jgi:hypothetical protein